jgi:hypothetical protein
MTHDSGWIGGEIPPSTVHLYIYFSRTSTASEPH